VTEEVQVKYIVLHSLLPCQPQETIDGGGDAEHHRGKPKGIDGIFKRSAMGIEGVLQSCRCDSREKCRHSRQVEEVGGTVLLCKPDGWDTCI
jgi:hypothetical protein